MKILFILCLLLSFSTLALDSVEPAYCAPENFSKFEVPSPLTGNDNAGLLRMHAYRLGSTTLVGLAVGDSKTPSTQKLAQAFGGPNIDQNKYCTWYFARSNKTALASFISHIIQDPFSIQVQDAPRVFMSAIQSSFFEDRNENFISCAQDYHYIAMGCTEQRHRGPTVFGMLLAFSGCKPDHAATIVNTIWGLNTLKPEVRFGGIKAAYDYGSQHPNERSHLAELLTRNN